MVQSVDPTQPSHLAFHRDIDPVRMMRTRFADTHQCQQSTRTAPTGRTHDCKRPLRCTPNDLLPGGGQSPGRDLLLRAKYLFIDAVGVNPHGSWSDQQTIAANLPQSQSNSNLSL